MVVSRMKGEDRKQAIIEAARPLFALHGFNGTSIRDIADAAGVSEALLYKHFPSKEALYSEIMEFAEWVSMFAVKEFKGFKTGTETLVLMIYFLVNIIMLKMKGKREQQEMYERLFFQSLLGDATYAREGLRAIVENVRNALTMNFDAAIQSGDVIDMPIDPINRFWFAHHMVMGIDLCHASGEPAFEYTVSKEKLAEHAVLFILRGIGMTDEAIRKYYNPEKLKAIAGEKY